MLLAQIYEDQCRKPRDFSPMSHSREVLVQQRDPLTFWNEDPENFWAEKKKKEEGPPHLSTFSPLQPINYESEGGLWGKKVVEYEVFSYSEGVVAAHTRQPSNRASLRRLCWCVPLVRWRDHRLAMASPRSQRTVSLSQLSTRQAVLCLFWKIHSLEKL